MLTLAMLELLRQRASIREFTDTPDPRALTAAAGTSTPVALPVGSTMAENLTFAPRRPSPSSFFMWASTNRSSIQASDKGIRLGAGVPAGVHLGRPGSAPEQGLSLAGYRLPGGRHDFPETAVRSMK